MHFYKTRSHGNCCTLKSVGKKDAEQAKQDFGARPKALRTAYTPFHDKVPDYPPRGKPRGVN